MKSNHKKTKPSTSTTNRLDDGNTYYGTSSLDHLVVIPKQPTSIITPKRPASPTNPTLRRSSSPIYPSNTGISNTQQNSAKRSLSPIPQESKKKPLDIDLKNVPSFLESPKGSPRSPKNNSNFDSPRLKGSELQGCESWEVVSKQDLDYRETLAAERFLRFLHGQPVGDAKLKFASINNTEYLFSDSEEENAAIKFIRMEELEKLMKENHPKNEKQYIYDWLNEIPQPNFEKIPENQTGDSTIDSLTNQFQTFKSVFNQMSEKIFKKWILSHRLERIVIDLVQKYQETKKQFDDLKTREHSLNHSIHEIVKIEVQKQLKTIMKPNEDTSIQSKEVFLKEIVRNEMEKITKKADIVLSEMKERNIQNKIDQSMGEVVDKILKETEEQFTFLTTSLGEIKKDVNDLKFKQRGEPKIIDMKSESTFQDLDKMRQYLESKTKEFTNNMVHQLENTSNLLERCNSIEKNSEKKFKEFQTRMERDLKDLRIKIESTLLKSNREFTGTTFEQQFQTMEKHLNEILLKKQLTEEESRRAIESIIKSNLMYSEDIHGLHIEQKTLENKIEEQEEEYLSLKDRVISLQQFKDETIEKLENFEMKRLNEMSDIQKLSNLLENVSSHLKDVEQRKNNTIELEEKINTCNLSIMNLENLPILIENIEKEQKILTLNQTQLFEQLSIEEKVRNETVQKSIQESEYSKMIYNTFSAKIEDLQSNYESLYKLSRGNLDGLDNELRNINEIIENRISNLKNELKYTKDENVSEKIHFLEAKIDTLRNEISKEMQMNKKYQNDSNKCIESSILILENSRNDNKLLIQQLEQKISNIEIQSTQLSSTRYIEIEKRMIDFDRNQNSLMNNITSNELLFKDISSKFINTEKTITNIEERLKTQLSEIKAQFQSAIVEISEKCLNSYSSSISNIESEIETLKNQHSSLGEDCKIYGKKVENSIELTHNLENCISSQSKQLEHFQQQYENFQKQNMDELNHIKSFYYTLKSKVEDYAVSFETLDLWKQGFNDSIVILKQKVQDNILQCDNLISRVHDLAMDQQKSETIQNSNTSISLELSKHSQIYNNQYLEIMDSISKLKTHQNTIEESLSNTLNQQIAVFSLRLDKFIDSEIRSTQNIEQSEERIKNIDSKQEELRSEFKAFKDYLQMIKNEITLTCNGNQDQIFTMDETIKKTKNELQEFTKYIDANLIEFKDSFPKNTVLNELEPTIQSLSCFKSINQNIINIQNFMDNIELIVQPLITKEINPVNTSSELNNINRIFTNKIEALSEKVEQIDSLKQSSTIETHTKILSNLDNNFINMEEELARLKAMMKEENNIQKKLIGGLTDWKNDTQEKISIFDQDLTILKENLDMKHVFVNDIIEKTSSAIKQDVLSKVDDVKQHLEIMKSNLSVLGDHLETMGRNLSDSKQEFTQRLTIEEEKVNELEQNIVDIYKKIITLYGQLDMQGEAAKLMENIVGIQEVLAESHKQLQYVCDNTLDEMESHAQSLINDFCRLIDEKVVKTRMLNETQFENDNIQNLSDSEYQSLMSQIETIQAELLKQQENQEEEI